MLGLKIFKIARGIAIASAMIVAFVSGLYFRNAFREMPRARATTKKNQSRITSFHLYFIRMKIRAKARANAKIRETKFGASFFGVSSPNGRPVPGAIDVSPVDGSMIVCGV